MKNLMKVTSAILKKAKISFKGRYNWWFNRVHKPMKAKGALKK